MEARFTRRGNCLALLLLTLPPLHLHQPHRISLPGFRQSDHPRGRAFFLQLVRQHHHDSRRNAGRTARAPRVRHLFPLATRSHRLRFLQLLVLPLVGSGDSDWEILFSQWGLLAQDQKIGGIMRTLGWLGMLATVAWLAYRVRHDAAIGAGFSDTRQAP